MTGRAGRRPRTEYSDATLQEPMAEEQPQAQFATVEQVTVLQNQLSTMMEMLSRMASQPHASEAPPAVEGSPSRRCSASDGDSSSRLKFFHQRRCRRMTRRLQAVTQYQVNWESILNDKVEEAIARRKSRVRPISIKEGSVYRRGDGRTITS
ncbi:Uncharacterized protein Adt_31478 [Abeliophyllum distichum]|uniref:Uncharacterized protein n=1 Tax=Abeliophyllum distichum TaxID=126358 RepID=A0ABD1RE70_9LAMI